MLYNYHTHTARCGHAEGTDREYVEKAIQSGLKTLGFSDHAPYLFENGYYSGFRMPVRQLEDYAESVRALQKEYAADIRILLGFELEYYPAYYAKTRAWLQSVQPDFCIMGQHFEKNEQDAYYAPNLPDAQAFSDYITQILEGLATGDFLYLAHPDLAGYRYGDEVVRREYRRLCEGAKKLRIPLEINLLGLRTKRRYPDERFFAIAAEVGNEIVVGADAHAPQDVFDLPSEQTARAWAQKLGLRLIEQPIL